MVLFLSGNNFGASPSIFGSLKSSTAIEIFLIFDYYFNYLPGRLTVGHSALDAGILVRVQARQQMKFGYPCGIQISSISQGLEPAPPRVGR